VNTSNVVLKATAMPESPKVFEAEDSDFGGGTWVPRCLAFANGTSRVQNRPKQTTIGPDKRASSDASHLADLGIVALCRLLLTNPDLNERAVVMGLPHPSDWSIHLSHHAVSRLTR
jgi:hypothetical protein